MDVGTFDTQIPVLGEAKITSPIRKIKKRTFGFVSDDERVPVDSDLHKLRERFAKNMEIPSFERAGPREKIYFDTSKLRCALVTCGGLCPGLNDIIRAIVLELNHSYRVRNIYGIRHGLEGFIPEFGRDVVDLNPDVVVNIHEMGGTILGSSRGPQDIEEIVDSLERMNIGILFMIGGDGTLLAASKITDAILERNLKISVVAIPKTIDNDIHMVSRSFGFHTAVEIATEAIKAAHNEAQGYPYGIGLIKLMGRYAGFIAATAALARQDVNFVLIPEVDFDLKGENGFLQALEDRILERGHAVIVVAEGAGQKFFEGREDEYDPSGNIRLKDIGLFLKDSVMGWFSEKDIDITLKYIDPSYMIRSLPANASDRVYCGFLGRNAVHAGMAGKTRLLIGRWNEQFVHVPMSASTGRRKKVDYDGRLWLSVMDVTGQGAMKNSPEAKS
ncbi:ATP-dependent 6-phosphofructokinase [Desulfobacterales bacterium HSG16]|nr:ATP-dependent 6-phosphofructokinase [Desulfobacterales bacterium HSG16]